MKYFAPTPIAALCLIQSATRNAVTLNSSNGIRQQLSPECFAHTSAVDTGIGIKISSTAKGLGAFAAKAIPFGTLLGEYGGETITKREAEARYWNKRKMDDADQAWVDSRKARGQPMTGNYLLELPDGTFVDAEDSDVSDWCRFMNHSGEDEDGCNVKAFMQSTIGGKTHEYPQMYAIKDIQVGEELCHNYGKHFFIKGAKREE